MTAPEAAAPVPLGKNRAFLLLWAGAAVSALGSQASAIAYPLLVLALTGSPAAAGLVAFAVNAPQLAFQIPAGALVDRWNRRLVMIGSDAGRLAAVASVAAVALAGRPSFALLVGAAFTEGTLLVFHNLAEPAAIRAIVAPAQLPEAVSRNEARDQVGAVAGRPLGAALLGVARWAPFLADAASYVVSIITVLLIRGNFRTSQAAPRTNVLAEMRDGVGWLWRNPFLRAATLLVAGSNLLFQALLLVILVIARENHISASVVGLILTVSSLGGVAGALAAPRIQRRLPMAVIVIGVNWLWTLLIPLLALARSPLPIAAVVFPIAFGGPVWNVAVMAYQLRITPDQLIGRVSGVLNMFAYGSVALGGLLAGFLISRLGTTGTIRVLAACMVALAIGATASRAIRRVPGTDTDPADAPDLTTTLSEDGQEHLTTGAAPRQTAQSGAERTGDHHAAGSHRPDGN